MTTIQEIEKAVSLLPLPELNGFRNWFDKFDSDSWDKQIEDDVHSGKFDNLASQALKDLANKRCVEL